MNEFSDLHIEAARRALASERLTGKPLTEKQQKRLAVRAARIYVALEHGLKVETVAAYHRRYKKTVKQSK